MINTHRWTLLPASLVHRYSRGVFAQTIDCSVVPPQEYLSLIRVIDKPNQNALPLHPSSRDEVVLFFSLRVHVGFYHFMIRTFPFICASFTHVWLPRPSLLGLAYSNKAYSIQLCSPGLALKVVRLAKRCFKSTRV